MKTEQKTKKWTEPVRPEWLSCAAAAEWDRIVEAARDVGTLASTDGLIVTIAATAAAELREAEQALELEGRVATYQNGMVGPSPWCKIRDAAARRLSSSIRALGLSPASRKAAGGALAPEGDELTEYLDAFDSR